MKNCLLCYDAKCAKVCESLKPDEILRSCYFDNKDYAVNNLPENLPCINCDGKCEKVCINEVKIRDFIVDISKDRKEKVEVNYDCLKTDFCGIELENPFLLSSSCVSASYDMIKNAYEAGWAGVCFKTISVMDINEASPRFSAIKDNDRIIGFKNIEQLSDHSLLMNLATINRLKQDYPNKFVMVSIMGRDIDEWTLLTQAVSNSMADAIELNFSCPNMTADNTGSDVGQIPDLVYEYTKACVKVSKKPILAKLTPNVANMAEAADAAIEAGANGVAAINTIKSLIDVDINPRDGISKSSVGGYSGKAVKPIALRFITQLSQESKAADTHISGMGGIETWRDALEFIVLGADSLQITTAIMAYGYRIIDDLKSGLAYYLCQNGFKSVKDLDGITVSSIVETKDLDRDYIIFPKFLRDKCVGCKRCYISCKDGGHQAITIKDDKPILDAKKCVGCHLCVLVCPKGAIVSSEVKVKKQQ